MKNGQSKTLKSIRKKRNCKPLYFIAVILFLVALWWIFAATVFQNNPVVPSPAEVLVSIFTSASAGKLWIAVWNTFLKSFLGFIISFVFGGALAIAANRFKRVKYCIDPIVTIIRAVPTLAVTYLLLMYLRTESASVIVGMLMVFPIFYAGLYTAVGGVDRKLLQMAKVYRVPPGRVLTGIVVPSVSPQIFSSALSAFSLNLKVVIAAEIVGGIAPNTIGNFMAGARSGFDYSAMFGWVLVAIILAFVCEGVLKLIMRFSLPWKYPTRKNIQKLFCRLFKIKPKESDSPDASFPTAYSPLTVRFQSVSFSFPDVSVFENFSEIFESGKVHCILGGSGSGKTTLLNLAANLLKPQSGTVTAEEGVSYLFQEPRLIPQKSVLQNLTFAILPQVLKENMRGKNAKKTTEARARAYLAEVGLQNACHKLPAELSGGMAQRAALARAFAVSDGLLLMDEPFKGLDFRLKQTVRELFLSLLQKENRTVLFVTHDIDEALLTADEILVFGQERPISALTRISVPRCKASRCLTDPDLLKIKEQIMNQ